MRKLLALAWSLLLISSASANAQTGKEHAAIDKENPATAAVFWTPVTVQVKGPVQLFRGSDGGFNLAYDVLITNLNKHPVHFDRFDVVDETGRTISTLDFGGESKDVHVAGHANSNSLQATQS
jgi:hypothetical protein